MPDGNWVTTRRNPLGVNIFDGITGAEIATWDAPFPAIAGDLGLSALPRAGGMHSVVAGETWNFQCWLRDDQSGPTSNFTEGISIVFQ